MGHGLLGVSDVKGTCVVELPGKEKIVGDYNITSDGGVELEFESLDFVNEVMEELKNDKLPTFKVSFGNRVTIVNS